MKSIQRFTRRIRIRNLLKENFTLIIFFCISPNWSRIGFNKPIF